MQEAFSVDDIEAEAPSLTMFERHIEDVVVTSTEGNCRGLSQIRS